MNNGPSIACTSCWPTHTHTYILAHSWWSHRLSIKVFMYYMQIQQSQYNSRGPWTSISQKNAKQKKNFFFSFALYLTHEKKRDLLSSQLHTKYIGIGMYEIGKSLFCLYVVLFNSYSSSYSAVSFIEYE